MKTCGVCGDSKPLKDFNRKGPGYQSRCRACQKEWYDNYYRTSPKEKARLEISRKAHVEALRNLIHQAKDKPCADCGQRFPYYVMDFDHRDPTAKEFTIARFVNYSMVRVQKEIEKCDVVCSNCHRERTHSWRVDSETDIVL